MTHEELELTVIDRRDEADGVISLTLENTVSEPLPPWSPGAHIDVQVDDLERQYSLCSDPFDRHRWRIAILHVLDGRGGSKRIHETFKIGDPLRTHGPQNHFELLPSRRYVFVAGGIGITPILPMVAEAERNGAEWIAIYGGRTRTSMAFVDELEAYGDRVRLVPEDTDGRVDFAGQFADVDDDTLIYCCGPEPLLKVVEAATAHWPEGSLHVERFVAKQIDHTVDQPFEVEFVESGVTAEIPADKSILEVAEDLGLPVVYSCREGTCGTCETVVLSGLPDHRDSILTEAERADNETMFICVSRSLRGSALQLEL